MSLKLALLLAGVIIVISVAVGAMDKARIRRRRQRRTPEQPPSPSGPENPDVPDPDEQSAPAALEKRKLQADSPVPLPDSSSIDRGILDELESYEQFAEQRLDVDPDIDRRFDEQAQARVSPVTHPTVADEKIDFVISLPARSPVSRNRALGLFKQNEYLLEKPRCIFGLRHVTKVWSNLETDPVNTEYDDLSLALQLVDKDGAVEESELNTFVQMGLAFGDRFRRRTLFSIDFEDALALALDLDEFCRKHDVIASINVVANSPAGFHGGSIEATLTDIGMRFGDMKIFHYYDDRGQLAFSLANLYQPGQFEPGAMDQFRTKGVTLFMQVPRVADCIGAFDDMITVAMQLADRLGGRLVDQNMKALTESGIRAIHRQIELIASDMRQRGIPCGGEAARRLFGV